MLYFNTSRQHERGNLVMVVKVGIDLGYGYVKVYPGEEKFRSSVYPHVSRYGIEEKKGIVTVDGETFEIGRARSVELRTKSFQGSAEWKALLLWALRNVTLPLKAVMGLPVSLSAKETRKRMEEMLVGIHTPVIDGEVKEIKITEVKVVPQGMGVLYDYFIENGRLVKERTKENIVVIDIGFYTTDILVYRHGEILEDRCTSYEIGVGWLYEKIREELKAKYSYPSLSLKEVEEYFERGYFPYEGRRIYINKEEKIREFKNRLIKELRAHEEDLKLADTVLWAGGGSLLLGVPCVDKPEFANARGFFKFAGICFGG